MCAILILTALLSSLPSAAQRYDITVFNNTHGLPGNQINDLFQDRFGRLWIGTMNGLTVYNGHDFEKFGRLEPVSTSPIRSIYEDSEGNVWVGLNNLGVCRYTGTVFEYFNDTNGFISASVNAITEDQRNHIWFGTSEGVFRFDGKQFHSYNELRGITDNNVLDVFCDNDGKIWAATANGVSLIDLPEITNFSQDDGLSSSIVYSVSQDGNGELWLGTYLGVTTYSGETFQKFRKFDSILTERIEKILHTPSGRTFFASYGGGVGIIDGDDLTFLTVREGLPSNIIKDLLIDREGNLWFATWNGLCRYNGNQFVTYSIDDGLNSTNLLSIARDSSNRIWFGTLTGGLNYYFGGKIWSIGQEQGLTSSTIWSISTDIHGDHWFGTTSGPIKMDLNEFIISNPYPELENLIIYTILHDEKEHKLYFGTDLGLYITEEGQSGFQILNQNSGLQNEKVRVLFEDLDGNLWIGTMGGTYVTRSDGEVIDFNEKFDIPKAPVTSIVQDSSKKILISTYDFGVFIYNEANPDSGVSVINSDNGLYSNKVLFTKIDRDKNLWLGTSNGLDLINWDRYLSDGSVITRHFNKSNGYQGVETNAMCTDRAGNLWFASVNGAIRLNIRSGLKDATLPLLRLTNIHLFNGNIDWKKKPIEMDPKTGLPLTMLLGHDNNDISFNFQGVYLSEPEEILYQFYLEGYDETWSPASEQTFANYSNLGPGDYIFKVRVSANGKEWSNPVTYTFGIKPPYWKTPFFYFLYVVIVVGGIFLFFRIRTRSLQRTQAILREKVEQRTQELNEKNLELEKLSIVASETDNAVLIFDESKNIEWANTGYTKMTGYTVDEIKDAHGKTISDLTFNSEGNKIAEECISTRQSKVFESRIPRKDGSMIWTSCTLTPIFHETGKLKKIVVINTNITLRKKMEEQIRDSLEEKGLLLKEIHHRVKNNLQIIISLFNLQTHYISDSTSLEALKEGQDRIKSMALIHERFYQAEGTSKIDFDEYIKRLTENLFISFNRSPDKIRLILDTEHISLDIDTAVPCGLIINELVSNALKHAFEGRDKGTLKISFRQPQNDSIRLVVEDDGIGLPPGFDMENSDSLGMQLMNALTSQLEGTLSLLNGNGTTFILEFKTKHTQEAEPVAG
jgi:PAS domain S-box-containing protein